MSSTNRGNKREVSDYYVTPQKEIDWFLDFMLEIEPTFLDGNILDPCAGGDDTHRCAYPRALERRGRNKITTLDIREDSQAKIRGVSYLRWKAPKQYDLTISNPPFVYLEEFVLKSLRDTKKGGWVAFLMPINFLRSKKRAYLWREKMPKYWVVHPIPISFTSNGKTDSLIYAHSVWKVGDYGRFSKMHVLQKDVAQKLKGFEL